MSRNFLKVFHETFHFLSQTPLKKEYLLNIFHKIITILFLEWQPAIPLLDFNDLLLQSIKNTIKKNQSMVAQMAERAPQDWKVSSLNPALDPMRRVSNYNLISK